MFDNNLQILWTARYDYRPNYKLNEHKHEFYQLIYFLTGQGLFILDGKEFNIDRDTILLIKPMQKHSFRPCGSTSVKTLDIKFVMDDTELRRKIDSINQEFFKNVTEVKSLLEKIKAEGNSKKTFYKEISTAYLKEILLHLLRNSIRAVDKQTAHTDDIDTSNNSKMVKDVIQYIHKHYSTPLSLTDIVESLNYNKSYVCQLFKKELKDTPMKYLSKYRIKKAGELILYSDYNLNEIAQMTGFKTIHHFNRTFTELTGTSPGRWRQKEREGIRKDIYFDNEFKNDDYISEN